MTDYKRIFNSIEMSLAEHLGKNVDWLKTFFTEVPEELSEAEYYRRMVTAIFAAGISIEVYEKKHDALMKVFPDATTVANYTEDQISRIKENRNIIRNKRKIDACVRNAKWFVKHTEEHGSFGEYVASFDPKSSSEALEKLRRSIDKQPYMGPVSSRHYLTMIGMPMIKPDEVICRVLYRLGFAKTANYNDPTTIEAAVSTAQAFANATGYSMRYVDLVLVNFGRAYLTDEISGNRRLRGICTSDSPMCGVCHVRDVCKYQQTRFDEMRVTPNYVLKLAMKLSPEDRIELSYKLKE